MNYKEHIYSYNEVFSATLDYFNGDEVATNVWISKYCLKDLSEDGKINYYELTPNDMFKRIASEISRAGNKYDNPLSYDEIYDLIKDFKYIVFQGRPMAGIGSGDNVSLSNCFVVGRPGYDSYGLIGLIDQQIMQISKRGGGVGTDLSDYRPNGSKVHNAAMTSSGPVEICANRFSNTIREVGQNGRRGALMLSMSINHPNAEEFMDSKMEEGKITGANISLKLYDDWMKSALGIGCDIDKEKNRLWKKIIHNATKRAEPGVLFWDTIIRESVPDCYADYGFKTLTTNPCFPSSEYILTDKGYVKFGDLYRTGGDNMVFTDNRISYKETKEVESPEQWHIDENKIGLTLRNASNVFLTKTNTEVAELIFSNGSKLRCTPDHHIATINRGMIEAKDLTNDDKILVAIGDIKDSIVGKMPETNEEILSLICGLTMGDGTFSVSNCQERCILCFWGKDASRMSEICALLIDKLYDFNGDILGKNGKKLSKYFVSYKKDHNNNIIKVTISSAYLANLLNKYFNYNKLNKHIVPDFILNNALTSIGKYFIAGIMYCDGSISGSLKKGITVRLNQSNVELLRQIQMMLGCNGFYANIKLRKKAQYKDMPNGKGGYSKYWTKDNYDLIISSSQSEDYIKYIGFLGDNSKENKFLEFTKNKIGLKRYTTLLSYKLLTEKEDVYCIKEPITRSIIVNGISTRRCGEIPLSNCDSCRLMVLNLYSYVKNPFTSQAYFDFSLFAEHARKIVKLMDNMIDLEIEQIDKIISKVENDPEEMDVKEIELNLWKKIKEVCILGRRSGIGITGEGDMLAAMGYKYGTKEASYFAASIQHLLALNVYIGSCNLVQIDHRPKFGCFNYDLEKNNPFLLRLGKIDENEYNQIVLARYIDEYNEKIKLGRRNIALLTIAPTGSVSCLTQTTSGVEPVFTIRYTRRRKIDKNSNIKPDFIDKTGDWFINFNIMHNKFIHWYSIYKGIDFNTAKSILENMNDNDFDEVYKISPYYKATAMDCNWKEKVFMQGSLQKYVDHSISVTINLPKDTSEDVVNELYKTAWHSGCKGCTIYVDGSRDGILLTKDKNNCNCKDFLEKDAPKRPKMLPCKVIRFTNNKEKWIAAVGLYEGKPYEIFTGLLEKLNIPNNIEDANIVRNKIEVSKVDEDAGEIVTKLVSRYDLVYYDNDEQKSVLGLSTVFNKEYWNYGKLVSGLLRHGMPIQYVIKVISSLDFKDDGINSWKNGVIRALKRFTKDGETDEICPECGAKLWRESGCVICKSCGWSKCG